MSLRDWARIKVRRRAIKVALRRPIPERLTLGLRSNNHYAVRLSDDKSKFMPRKLTPAGADGFLWIEGQPRVDASLTNEEIGKREFSIEHHYRGLRILTTNSLEFVVASFFRHPFFALTRFRVGQFLFNRRRLARQDRIAILKYIFEKTVENPDFRTSSIDLPATMYGMRFYGRDALLAYYELLLQSLVSSGELLEHDHSIKLSPRALETLHAHEMQEERHSDNRRVQNRIAWLTAVIAFLALTQIAVNVWSELNPDPQTTPAQRIQ